ncbi:MAG: DUF86 domain-containing protein [Candidatus Micrarchaeota archaeon]|nr:DUF86 domain-containing protein [Candidatus Micrarchaeota archaeon]
MPRDYRIYLNDIIESAGRIDDYTEGSSLKQLSADRMRADAVIRNLMVIGEAAKNIPAEIRSMAPDVEWEEISGLRDVLIHQYFGADLEIIWGVIRNDLPKLKKRVGELLKKA